MLSNGNIVIYLRLPQAEEMASLFLAVCCVSVGYSNSFSYYNIIYLSSLEEKFTNPKQETLYCFGTNNTGYYDSEF